MRGWLLSHLVLATGSFNSIVLDNLLWHGLHRWTIKLVKTYAATSFKGGSRDHSKLSLVKNGASLTHFLVKPLFSFFTQSYDF